MEEPSNMKSVHTPRFESVGTGGAVARLNHPGWYDWVQMLFPCLFPTNARPESLGQSKYCDSFNPIEPLLSWS